MSTKTPAHPLQDELLARFPGLAVRFGAADGLPAVNVAPEHFLELAAALHGDFGFSVLADLAGCDWGVGAARRFGAVYHFQAPVCESSASAMPRLTLRVGCDAEDNAAPTLPSLSSLYASALWFEREAFDLLGIRFDGHPALTRLLLSSDFIGHPLRKDYPLSG